MPDCCNPIPKRVIRLGRAHWVCAECRKDVTFYLMLLAEAGVDLDKIKWFRPSTDKPTNRTVDAAAH